MSCGCSNIDKSNGKNVVDLIRSKNKDNILLSIEHDIECINCNNVFTMKTHVDKCPHCHMVYGVTPCSSHDKNNIRHADINY